MTKPIIIVGAGLTGLTTALQLHKAGKPYLVLEASDRVGGRLATDEHNGYMFDRGFQVYLTAYPDAASVLDTPQLGLQRFKPGAVILLPNGKKSRIGDPTREISSLISTLSSPVGTFSDKTKMLRLKRRLDQKSLQDIFSQEGVSTRIRLREFYGFSDRMIDQFFMPFFRGIFLEDKLDTDHRMFEFVFKMFGKGHAAVPKSGMEAIPKQIANQLSTANILLDKKVTKVSDSTVQCADGSSYEGSRIVIATEGGSLSKDEIEKTYRSTTNMYFTASSSLGMGAYIALNPDPKGIVNNLCEISMVAPSYAKDGHLISLTLRDHMQKASVQQVKHELSKWWSDAQKWEHIKTYRIDYALPNQDKVSNDFTKVDTSDTIIKIGDYLLNGSINAAIKVGKEVGSKLAIQG